MSWHVMATGVDKGDLLLRSPVPIADDDTAVSLNTKCFVAAMESFPRLVEGLEAGAVRPEPQDLARRTYFGRSDKPEASGALDWRAPSEMLARMVRALDTGRYANPLASAKLLLADGTLLVEGAVVVDTESTAAPGTVLATEGSLLVRAGQGALEITALREPGGRSVPVSEAVERWRLSPGVMLPVLDDGRSERLRTVASAAALREGAWVRRLEAVEAAELPYRSSRRGAVGGTRAHRAVKLPEGFQSLVEGKPELVAGAFQLFLGRALGQSRFHVAVADDATVEARAGAEMVTLPLLFHTVDLSAAGPAASLAVAALDAARETAASGPVLSDLGARYPRVGANPAVVGNEPVSVALVFGEAALPDAVARAELVLQIAADGSAILHHDPAAYPRAALDRLAHHFEALCGQLLIHPECPFAELDLLTDEERGRLLVAWNDTALEHDRSLTLHGAFEAQARKTPEAVAAVFHGRALTYRELDARAAALAAELRGLGCRPGTLVGVHVPRSLELLVATLGVLKSGAAYVPLDPAFPADRLEFMIADSAMPVIVSHSRVRGTLPASAATVLAVDAPRGMPDAPAPGTDAAPEDLAYCIYTSGSTGRPKGVLLEHRNVVNFFAAMDEVVPREGAGQPVWLAVTSLSFDISVLELFWTLARGFKVVIHDEA
ncbi:MAG: AMP-binding protein, partial [Pseudomonadales bacterium]|nr:AMP-binding protein [Pseudomonadales bacterium]